MNFWWCAARRNIEEGLMLSTWARRLKGAGYEACCLVHIMRLRFCHTSEHFLATSSDRVHVINTSTVFLHQYQTSRFCHTSEHLLATSSDRVYVINTSTMFWLATLSDRVYAIPVQVCVGQAGALISKSKLIYVCRCTVGFDV